MVVLTLNFEVVGDQVDRPARVHCMLRFERRITEVTSTTATTAVALATRTTTATAAIRATTLATTVRAIATTCAASLILTLALTTMPLLMMALTLATVIATTTLASVELLLATTHIMVLLLVVLLLLPGLALAHVLWVASSLVMVVHLTTPIHVGWGSLPVLLTALVVSAVVRLLIVVLHLGVV